MATAEPAVCGNNTKNAYIYGTLSFIVISCISLIGAVIIPCLKKRSRHRWMQVFIAIAIATMAGDALLHLIPAALDVHHHGGDADCKNKIIKPEDLNKNDIIQDNRLQTTTGFEEFENGGHGEQYNGRHGEHDHHGDHKMPLIRMSVVYAAVYLFYLFEMVARGMAEQRKKNSMNQMSANCTSNENKVHESPHRARADDKPFPHNTTDLNSGQSSTRNGNSYQLVAPHHAWWSHGQHRCQPMGDHLPPHMTNVMVPPEYWARNMHTPANAPAIGGLTKPPPAAHGQSYVEDTWGEEQPNLCCGFKPLAVMILMGGAIHNFANGMAVGVSFSKSNVAGFSTTLAIICHEVAHEIGDFAILIDMGLPVWKALTVNFLSALPAFGGLYFGIAAGEMSTARPWLFAVASGMFIYLAWVAMMHHLKEYKSDDPWYVNLALQNGGLLLGFLVIFLVGWFEEDIQI